MTRPDPVLRSRQEQGQRQQQRRVLVPSDDSRELRVGRRRRRLHRRARRRRRPRCVGLHRRRRRQRNRRIPLGRRRGIVSIAQAIRRPVTACRSAAVATEAQCRSGTPSARRRTRETEENDSIPTTWLTADATLGVGHTVVPPDFFEGGIDLTEAFEGLGEVPSCFSTFLADTRSPQSLTATLFDFAAAAGGCIDPGHRRRRQRRGWRRGTPTSIGDWHGLVRHRHGNPDDRWHRHLGWHAHVVPVRPR